MKISLQQRPVISRRTGYTLIEMLIAVSLVAVLMIAVWGLMSMYARLQTTGAEATAEQQLVRSVLQLVHSDLTTVSLPPAELQAAIDDPFAAFDPVEVPTDSGSNTSDSFGVIYDISDLQRHANAGPANITLTGSETAIRFTVPRPAAPLSPKSDIDRLNELGGGSAEAGSRLPDGVAPVVSEFQTIVWQFQQFGSTEQDGLPFGLYRIQTDAARMQTILSYQQRPEQDFNADPIALNREMLELLLFPPPDEFDQSSAQPTSELRCDLIPEIVGCRFEYSSGGRWHDSWQEHRVGTLPDAVRVQLDVVTTRQLDSLRTVYVSAEPPGPLEKQLSQTFARPEFSRRNAATVTTLEELRIVPHQYASIILLNPTLNPGSRAPLNDGGFDL